MGGIGQPGTLIITPSELELTTQATLTSTMVVSLVVAATVGRQLWENLLTLRSTTTGEVRVAMGYGLLQKQGFVAVVATAVDVGGIGDTTFEFVAHFASTATVANSADGANDVLTLAKCLSFAIKSMVIIVR